MRASKSIGTDAPTLRVFASRSCMHVDSYATNAYNTLGPIGLGTRVQSDAIGLFGGECPHAVFDRRGNAITVCVKSRQPLSGP